MFPNNPQTIILRNKYYPKGLPEDTIYKHYIKNKNKILAYTQDRYIMFRIAIDTNKTIIRRNFKDGKIILTNDNYEKIITGRTLVLYPTMKELENICIVDIDGEDFSKNKEDTMFIYDYLLKVGFKNQTIYYTGKRSFHIIVHLKGKENISSIRSQFKDILSDFESVDMSPNKLHGAWTCPYGLSEDGLIAREIPRLLMLTSKKENCIIKQ
jgi:uncharacterized protein YnzC (UPF0291/DUF896 family)